MKHRIIKMLLVLAAAYTNTPIFSQDASTAVGTPNGTFEVSNLGAAQYHIQIEVPDGGPLMPDVSINYNSQSGNGLVGYGFSIGGLQCITRGGKDLFRDGVKTGVKYDANDAFFLNGVRLIIQGGTYGADGSIYAPEGDPHTTVTLHNSAASTSSWFSVIGKDGKEYEFGNTTDSRYSFTDRKNASHTAAWYINKVSDSHTNYMTYSYTTSNYVIRPTRINYGMNRGITNSVVFNYSTLPAASVTKFAIGDRQGTLDVYLNSIVTQTGNSIYRTYDFTYNGTSDATALKHYRLIRVDMKNGSGEATSPIQIQWNYLTNPAMLSTELDVATKIDEANVEEIDKTFSAVDLTGDGVSDIIRIVPLTRYNNFFGSEGDHTTRVYISRSKVSIRGEVAYENPIMYTLQGTFSMDDFKSSLGGISVTDFDGDGYNDLIFPFHNKNGNMWNYVKFQIIRGNDVAAGRRYFGGEWDFPLKATDTMPLIAIFDTDGNGKDDVVCLEQNKKDGSYPAIITKLKEDARFEHQEFTVSLLENPEKLFSGDYNNDGLTDLIVFYNGGYKIYFNNGGDEAARKFTESNVKTGTMQKNCWRIQKGDFDGDGLTDFVYNIDGDTFFWIARNNGDGTFTQTKSDDIGFGEQDGNGKDNNRFSVMVWDMDQDGRSDVMVCKADYKHIKNWFENYWSYRNTYVRCLYSDGTTLKLKKSYTKNRGEDANERYIFLGDFDGDGYLELANYGSKLNSTDDTFNEKINVYKSGSALPQRGKVSKITDGLGNYHTIKYAYATNPVLYKNNRFGEDDVNSYTLPVSVVDSVNSSRGAAGVTTTKYTYEDLLLHLKGKGMLGFNAVRKENTTLKTSETIRVTEWDQTRWTPKKIETISTVGDATSRIVAESTVANMGKNYFAYVSNKEITDPDGNQVSVQTTYDTAKGVVTKERIDNVGEGMYKMVEYTGYSKFANRWLPYLMTATQKHSDANEPHSSKTKYAYTSKGEVASIVTNIGTPMALRTEYTYDIYGNVISSMSSGQNVKTVKTINTYDATGRFVTKTRTSPASAVKTYTYDIWGNMLTECDETDASNKLTTTYTYDGWGRLKTKTIPEGLCTNYETGWASGGNKKYYTKETGTAMPPVTIYYDAFGRELQRETKGPQNIDITKTTSYNKMGLVSQVTNVTGKLTLTDKYTYDTRGRMLSETSGTGKSTTYSYGNRTVTITTAGRTYTKTTDAWGNIIRSSDPQNEVEYQYFSNGKPSSITTNGSTVSMTYDVAGNQTSLTDPDAGTSTYTYAADGTLLTQTDGRGVETIFNYDKLGRIESKQVGMSTIHYTYGTTGVEKLRLIKETLDDKTVEYTHDKYGRLLKETRTVGDKGTYTFFYKYNAQDQLSETIYPGDLTVTYLYDENGYKTQTQAGTAVIYQLTGFDGLVSSSSFMGKLTSTTTRDTHGYLQSLKIADEWTVLEQFDTQYEASTGNLLSRQYGGYGGPKETFTYDNLDRLVSVKAGSKETMRMDYAENGNILYKTGIGAYEYNAYDHPHAVTDVEDVDMNFPNRDLSTSFNDFGKIERIVDCKRMPPARPGRSLHRPTPHAIINFEYGPHQERWYSESILLNKRFLTTIYAGDYEKITNYGSGEAHVKEFYYLDGNTIVIKENGKFQNFLAFTDNIGSILSVIDEEGRRVFDASYDAWGRQTVTKNEIGLRRGYTGHEMLNEVGIINMNGRLYDPLLGRFLSPDNYVQAPGNSQSFNRYSYCLNNPLKYVDPSGELFGIDDAVIAFTIFNVASSMMQASFEGRNVWRAGALSLLSSAASYGIGAAFGNVGSFGNELLRAGAHGLSSGVFNALDGGSFGSSFVSGAISSGIGSYAQGVRMDPGLMLASTTAMGGVAAWVTGGDFLAGAMNGLQIGMLNHLQHDGDGGTRYYRDQNGELCGEIPEVVIRPSMNTGLALQGVLTIGSGATTFFEHNNYSRTFSHWRGKNGKLYSGLTGRGPNQYTGSRSLAMEKAMKFNKAGKVLGGINTTMSISEFGNSLINSGMTVETIGYGADAVFGTIGTFGGIKGFAIDLYYQNVMKNYSLIRMSTGRQLIDRANMMQRGFIPVGYPGRSFK